MSYFKKFEVNKKGDDYVVGDIHGMFGALMEELSLLGFNFDTDRLFSVGDLCDRGPDSPHVLDLLSQPWFHPVMGNHEQILFMYENKQWFDRDMIDCGAGWWLKESQENKKKILQKYKKLPVAIEVQTASKKIGIVHAECPVSDWSLMPTALSDFNSGRFIDTCLWSKHAPDIEHKIANVDAVIVGHMTQNEYLIRGNTHLIDTGAVYENGKFTILHLDTLTPAFKLSKLKI